MKDRIVTSIEAAKADLQQALAELDALPTLDSRELGFTVHALNNYLLVTGGLVALLASGLVSHPDPEVQVWLAALDHANDLMAHLVRQLRAPHAAEVNLLWERVDLARWAERVCRYYQGFADRKRIRIHFEPAVAAPAYAWTDRVVTAVVLDNLLTNALKYSPFDRQVWVSVRAEPPFLVCSVRDEGPGLSAEDQAKLFQKGCRLSAVPTGGESSTGFGLAVAKELLDRLGGAIWCESQPGEGACFSFRLPQPTEAAHPSALAGLKAAT